MEEKFRHLVDNGHPFEFNEYFSGGWQLFKKGAGLLILFTLIYFGLSAGSEVVLELVAQDFPLLSGVLNIVMGMVIYIILAGVFVYLRNLKQGKGEFGHFFGAFSLTGNLILFRILQVVVALPIVLIVFATILPWEALYDSIESGSSENLSFEMMNSMGNMGGTMAIGIIAAVILAIYISISYQFALQLIVDCKMPAWKAMETSRRVAAKNFFSYIGFWLVIGLLMIIGILITCGVGLIILFPYALSIQFYMYDRIFKPHINDNMAEIDSFGTAQEDINLESDEDEDSFS